MVLPRRRPILRRGGYLILIGEERVLKHGISTVTSINPVNPTRLLTLDTFNPKDTFKGPHCYNRGEDYYPVSQRNAVNDGCIQVESG